MGRSALVAPGALAAASLVHAAWAFGVTWPAADRRSLAEAVAGSADMPGALACGVVSATLAAAAALTAGAGANHPVAVLSRAAVAAALLGRAGTGLAGRTSLLVPWTPSQHFVELDRRVYGPVRRRRKLGCATPADVIASVLLPTISSSGSRRGQRRSAWTTGTRQRCHTWRRWLVLCR